MKKLLLLIFLTIFIIGCESLPTKKTHSTINYEKYINQLELVYLENNLCNSSRDLEAKEYIAKNIRFLENGKYFKNKYELMQSQNFFIEKDKDNIILFLNGFSLCNQNMVKGFWAVDGKIALLWKDYTMKVEQIFLDFIAKKINVSELNKKLDNLNLSHRKLEESIQQSRYLEYQNSHDKEVDRNIEIYKAKQKSWENSSKTTNWGDVYLDLMKQNQNQKIDNITNTNCRLYGNTVSCTSY